MRTSQSNLNPALFRAAQEAGDAINDLKRVGEAAKTGYEDERDTALDHIESLAKAAIKEFDTKGHEINDKASETLERLNRLITDFRLSSPVLKSKPNFTIALRDSIRNHDPSIPNQPQLKRQSIKPGHPVLN